MSEKVTLVCIEDGQEHRFTFTPRIEWPDTRAFTLTEMGRALTQQMLAQSALAEEQERAS